VLIAGLALPYVVAFAPGPAGNPDNIPYAGQQGSVYDIKANPPQTIGTVTYDPYEPLEETGVNGPPPAATIPGETAPMAPTHRSR